MGGLDFTTFSCFLQFFFLLCLPLKSLFFLSVPAIFHYRVFLLCSIDMRGVVSKIEELFKGNQNLIVGFNSFLPKQYEIVLPPKDDPPKDDPQQ